MTATGLMLERDTSARLARLAATARRRLRRGTPRMRSLIASPGGRLEWRDVPVPEDPGPLGALVRPIAMATCDLDRPLVLGETPFPLPLQLGHECVAEVVSVGSEVTTVRAGDRVVVPFEISCGTCSRCRAGLTANCTGVPPISLYGFGLLGGLWGGTYADQLAVPYADAMLVPLPGSLDPVAAASVADTVCDGYRHIAPHLPVSEVLIVSALDRRHPFSASTALYAGLIARALGATQVLVADAREHVRREAARLGLTPLHPRQLRRQRPAPLVVDVSTTPRGLNTALTLTAPDGVCTSSGTLHASARIPGVLLYGRNVTFHIGRANTRALIPGVLDLMASGALRPQDVTTHVGSLDDAPKLLTEHMLGDATKTILTAR